VEASESFWGAAVANVANDTVSIATSDCVILALLVAGNG
jgi:hypothetical protein